MSDLSQKRHLQVGQVLDNLHNIFEIDVSMAFRSMFSKVCQQGAVLGLLTFAGLANAARPMSTDDANVVDPNSCQLESWVKTTHTSFERWAIPGCNLGADIEWSVGGNAQQDINAASKQFWLAQAKKRWRVVGDDTIGFSTTLGVMETHVAAPGQPVDKDYFVNVPVTIPLGEDRFVHLNGGWVNHQTLKVTRPTWGLGGEWPLRPNVIAIAETYGESNAGTRYQVGLRFWVVPKRMQIDTTYGNQVGQPEHLRWFTLGIRLLSPPLW
jgi:hypothetical protein